MFGLYLTKFASVILVRAGYVHLRASKALAKVLHSYLHEGCSAQTKQFAMISRSLMNYLVDTSHTY